MNNQINIHEVISTQMKRAQLHGAVNAILTLKTARKNHARAISGQLNLSSYITINSHDSSGLFLSPEACTGEVSLSLRTLFFLCILPYGVLTNICYLG